MPQRTPPRRPSPRSAYRVVGTTVLSAGRLPSSPLRALLALGDPLPTPANNKAPAMTTAVAMVGTRYLLLRPRPTGIDFCLAPSTGFDTFNHVFSLPDHGAFGGSARRSFVRIKVPPSVKHVESCSPTH